VPIYEFLEFRLDNTQDRTLLKIRHEYSLVHACDILREIKTFALLIPAHELPSLDVLYVNLGINR